MQHNRIEYERAQQGYSDLPFAILDERHGWGVLVRLVKPHHRWAVEPRWHMVQFAAGVECRTNNPGEGYSRFFSWKQIADYVRDYEASRERWPCVYDHRSVWRLLYRMWG